MQILHRCCCGLDVHKKLIVACLISLNESGDSQKEIRYFTTMTKDILALADWLTRAKCTHIANVLRRFSLPKWEPTCSVFPQQGTWPRGSASVQATIKARANSSAAPRGIR